MKQHEKYALLQRLEGIWPSMFRDKETFMAEFSDRLDPHPLNVGANAINSLIETKKIGSPTIADLVEFLPSAAPKQILNDCKICLGSGWIFIKKDFVKDCECSPRSEEVKASDRRTSKKETTIARMPESWEEAQQAFQRGLNSVQQHAEVF